MRRLFLGLLLGALAAMLWNGAPSALAQDTLRVGVRGLPPGMGNPFTANGTPSDYLWDAVFDGLTALDAEGKIGPALATEWARLDDLRWRFVLRDDVRFHNGEMLTAEAVIATLNWLRSDDGRSTVVGAEVKVIDKVEADGPDAVIITTSVPDTILPQRLSAAMIVPPAAWAELGPDEFAVAPVGTGPYRVTRWESEDGRVFLEAADSWRAPKLPELVFFELPEGAARVQALAAGQIDLTTISIDDIGPLEARGFQIWHRPSMQVMSVAFIARDGDPDNPLGDVRVRRALNHAIDREAMAEALLLGMARPAGQPASQVTVGYNPGVEPYAYDPDRARALLAEAGYPDGFSMAWDVIINSVPGDAAIYQTTVSFLSQIGVDVELRTVPFSAWLSRYWSGEWGGIQATGLSYNATPYNDAFRPMTNFSCNKPNPFFCEPEVAEALAKVNRIVDPEERDAALRAVSARYHDIAPSLFLFEQIDLFAGRPDLSGFELINRVPVYEALDFE